MDYARKIRETVTTVTKYLIGGLAGGVASTLTNPLDVVRIRLQNQTSGQQQYTGMVQGMGACWREEGMRGLTRGLYASWGRELTYSSARIGLYEPIRGFVDQAVGGESHGNSQEINPAVKFISAFLSGSIGSAVCNPCDLVKTRQQLPPAPAADASAATTVATSSNFRKHVVEVREIYASSGIKGFYRGWQATSARAAMLTSAQVGSYDSVKNNIAIPLLGFKDGVLLHLMTSSIAAVVTTTASNPFDVVKTRYMCDSTGRYTGVVDCAMITMKEGPSALLRGWVPAYSRVLPHTVITFMMIEQVRVHVRLRARLRLRPLRLRPCIFL
jgi:hypothetical protein